MKFLMHNNELFLEQNISFSNQSKCEFLKYGIRKKCAYFSKVLFQESRKQRTDLRHKTTKLEQDIDSEEKFDEHDKTRSELEK